VDEFQLAIAKATNEKVLFFRDIGHLVLDPSVTDGELRHTIYQYVPANKLQGLSKSASGWCARWTIVTLISSRTATATSEDAFFQVLMVTLCARSVGLSLLLNT
jgi:hypothetical protein